LEVHGKNDQFYRSTSVEVLVGWYWSVVVCVGWYWSVVVCVGVVVWSVVVCFGMVIVVW
jgi:hypothetical protein